MGGHVLYCVVLHCSDCTNEGKGNVTTRCDWRLWLPCAATDATAWMAIVCWSRWLNALGLEVSSRLAFIGNDPHPCCSIGKRKRRTKERHIPSLFIKKMSSRIDQSNRQWRKKKKKEKNKSPPSSHLVFIFVISSSSSAIRPYFLRLVLVVVFCFITFSCTANARSIFQQQYYNVGICLLCFCAVQLNCVVI